MGKLVAAAVIAATSAGAVGTGVVVSRASSEALPQARVERVVDGDTLDVLVDGTRTRIRLLNVDAPETKHPSRPVECLGPEAAAYLTKVLPTGTSVSLEYDVERRDRYGRTLAGVRLADGSLVNTMLARRGLAVPVVFGQNRRFYPAVLKAKSEAEASRVGFFGGASECTVPARLSDAEAKVSSATSGPSEGGKVATAAVTALAADLGASSPALEVRALGRPGITAAKTKVVSLGRQLAREGKSAAPISSPTTRRAATPTRTSEPRGTTRRETAASPTTRPRITPQPQPQPQPRQTPRLPQPRQTAQSPRLPEPQRTPRAEAPKPPSGGGRPSNAAPCRSYAPGGKTWTPIPCP